MDFLDYDILNSFVKPRKLSDPYGDFTKDQDILQEILDCPNDELGRCEFSCLFQASLPAGNFYEVAYYIPFALRFIVSKHKDSATVADYFIRWVAYNINDLKHYKLLDKLLMLFESLADELINNFSIYSPYGNFYLPRNKSLLTTILEVFNEYENFNCYGDTILKKVFGTTLNYHKAAWGLLLLEECNSKFLKSKILEMWNQDKRLKKDCIDQVLSHISYSNDIPLINFWDEILNCHLEW